METIYNVDYFIAKYTAIPEELWTVDTREDGFGRRCAHGHCAPTNVNAYQSCNTPEEVALRALSDLQDDDCFFVNVNNGRHRKYKQSTPKQRILAALYDIKAKQQPVAVEPKEKVIYKTVVIDSAVKALQEAELHQS